MKSTDISIIVNLNDKDLEKAVIKKENLVEVLVPVFRGGKTYYRKQWVRKPSQLTNLGKTRKHAQGVYIENKGKSPKTKVVDSEHVKGDKPVLKHVLRKHKLKFFYSVFLELKKDRTKALEYLKMCGVTWEKSSNPAVNWERACSSAKKFGNRGE